MNVMIRRWQLRMTRPVVAWTTFWTHFVTGTLLQSIIIFFRASPITNIIIRATATCTLFESLFILTDTVPEGNLICFLTLGIVAPFAFRRMKKHVPSLQFHLVRQKCTHKCTLEWVFASKGVVSMCLEYVCQTFDSC